MTTQLTIPPVPESEPPPAPNVLALSAFTYEDRAVILPDLSEAMTLSGCWLLDRKAISTTQIHINFEVELSSVMDMYAAILVAGIDLTQASHTELTSLCTVQHHSSPRNGLITGRLAISFLEDLDLPSVLARRFFA